MRPVTTDETYLKNHSREMRTSNREVVVSKKVLNKSNVIAHDTGHTSSNTHTQHICQEPIYECGLGALKRATPGDGLQDPPGAPLVGARELNVTCKTTR